METFGQIHHGILMKRFLTPMLLLLLSSVNSEYAIRFYNPIHVSSIHGMPSDSREPSGTVSKIGTTLLWYVLVPKLDLKL